MKYFAETEPNMIWLRGSTVVIERQGTDKYGERLFELPFNRIYTKTEMMILLTEAMTWVLKEVDDE